MASAPQPSVLGKYREIVIAVAFFLVFDLAVLVLNFVISFQIADDALAINLAGRQRMLSQRMTKAVLQVDAAYSHNLPYLEPIQELRQIVPLFDDTLEAFKEGGRVQGTGNGRVDLAALGDARQQMLLAHALAVWQSVRDPLIPVMDNHFGREDLQQAVAAVSSRNLELLALTNKLTTDLETQAASKANRLRWVQTGGILLALLNFGFILFKFLRKLRDSDDRVAAAQQETGHILATVREGLFLIDQQFCVGQQHSSSLTRILGRPVAAGGDFREVLRQMVSAQDFAPASDFIALLLGGRVKESLVQELNPLTEVAVKDEYGVCRYLSMQFNRVSGVGGAQLLVTVQDVSQRVELAKELERAQRRSRSEFDVLLRLMRVNPRMLNEFLSRAREALVDVNDSLRQADSSNYRRMVEHIFRQMHWLKADASCMGLELFERLAHAFEDTLLPLRGEPHPSGEQLLSLLPHLDEFMARIDQVAELTLQMGKADPAPLAREALAERLNALVERVAGRHGKRAELVLQLADMDRLPVHRQQAVQDVVVQLVRNAVVHGLELPSERHVAGKPAIGRIHVNVLLEGSECEVEVRDDGAGIQPPRIRERLFSTGQFTPAQLADMDDKQLVLKIFEPGFTTAEQPDVDAGRGVGLDVVKQQLQSLGAQLRLASRAGGFTAFNIRFAL